VSRVFRKDLEANLARIPGLREREKQIVRIYAGPDISSRRARGSRRTGVITSHFRLPLRRLVTFLHTCRAVVALQSFARHSGYSFFRRSP